MSYTNVFWGGRSEIKPSEISPFAYVDFCRSARRRSGDDERVNAEASRSRARAPAIRIAILIATVIAVAAIAFVQSYARWLDPIIDTGRDLYIPEQIARGAKLYRDIRYQYPPLAPYLLALITGAIGHSLAAYVAIGIAQSAAIAASLWIALRRPLPAFAATLSFVAIVFLRRVDVGRELHLPVQLRARRSG